MINSIIPTTNNVNLYSYNRQYKKAEKPVLYKNYPDNVLLSSNHYNVNFTGFSHVKDYHKTSHYLAARALEANKGKYNADGSLYSAKNIESAIKKLFRLNSVYLPFTMAETGKIKWKNYIPQDVREFSINKINDARIDRFNRWKNFLENPIESTKEDGYEALAKEIQEDDCLKFVIWNAINSEIKPSNRHIPVPFDIAALAKTVSWLNSIEPENRRLQAVSTEDFLKMYTHKLKDELLMSRPDLLMTKEYIPDANAFWVRIPSLRKDTKNKLENISALEKLSNENWCTRSSVDKAEAALSDGDFYLYLRRDKDSPVWQTIIGMTSYKGAIDQIQGANNDNLIPLKELDNVKKFIKDAGLKCVSGYSDEGPKALQQILIAEKLKGPSSCSTYPQLSAAISKKYDWIIFNILGMGAFIQHRPSSIAAEFPLNTAAFYKNSILEISHYRPSVLLDSIKGIKVPLSFLGINEDELLKNVAIIKGDLVLVDMCESEITAFPPNLREVRGKIVCTKEQYEKFKEDMLKVVSSPNKISIKK